MVKSLPQIFASRSLSYDNAYSGSWHNLRILRRYDQDYTGVKYGWYRLKWCSYNWKKPDGLLDWSLFSLAYESRSITKTSSWFFGKNRSLKFLRLTDSHMKTLGTVIYLTWYWLVQKTLTGWNVRTAAYNTIQLLSCTVISLVCVHWSWNVLQKGVRSSFSVLVPDMSCAQSFLRAHLRHFSLILPV